MTAPVERFAPSPTGYLHLGHAYSAWTAWSSALAGQGHLRLRIEDIDRTRSRPGFDRAIREDLAWLGITWDDPVVRQSEQQDVYQTALATLTTAGLCYPCNCTRRDIREALQAPHGQSSPPGSGNHAVYPGTCRERPMSTRQPMDAIRLNMAALLEFLGGRERVSRLTFEDVGTCRGGVHALDPDGLLATIGDVVLARGDIGTSYHLSVVIDDAAMGVTHVTRGEDLFAFTGLHRLLQAALDLPMPIWRHHLLVRDEGGKRLAKRDDARSLRSLREAGWQPDRILALLAGITRQHRTDQAFKTAL